MSTPGAALLARHFTSSQRTSQSNKEKVQETLKQKKHKKKPQSVIVYHQHIPPPTLIDHLGHLHHH